ncbi:MAG: thioredoxin family protein [Mariniphaga sp.]
MRKSSLLIFVLLISFNLQAQIYWLSDFKQSKTVAKDMSKLILIDFWADWCGPCKKMDADLWHLPEIQKLDASCVCVKVNIDFDKATAMEYNLQVIPKVVLATATGEVIWEKQGFMNAESYLSVLGSIPANVKTLNEHIMKLEENKNDAQENLLVGREFQQVGKDLSNNELKSSFLNCCEKYLTKAEKKSTDLNLTEEIQLYSSLNDVYWNKDKKALKKIEKINPASKTGKLSDLRHFILAKCYKNGKDLAMFEKEKQLIITKDYLDQLDNSN